MDYLKNLNEEQREAVLHDDGPLLILAGAGSGKTATMTRRIARLIMEKEVDPYNILAVTFTNKAAGEMRRRVTDLVGEGVNMWILTFHSACLRILRANAEKVGYAPEFTVYDPQDQLALIRKIMKENKAIPKDITPRAVLSVISRNKEAKCSPRDFIRLEGESYMGRLYGELYKKYEEYKRANNAMDFDDLLLNAVLLLENNQDVLAYYGNRFRYIMVDEYQDTNHLQYLFIKYLANWHGNICVVGDDDQCIYEWRGADISNILNFQKDFPKAKLVKLERNYRSKGNILAAANSTISRNRGRMEKKLKTVKDDGAKINYRLAQDERNEAQNVVREIMRLMRNGDENGRMYDYRDFAVLYRTNGQSRNFEEAFLQNNIPYRVIGGIRYYERAEIKDLLAYLALIANFKNDVAFERIINKPSRKIGEVTVDKIRTFAAERGISMFEAVAQPDIRAEFSSAVKSALTDFAEMILELAQDVSSGEAVTAIYDGVLEKSGYVKGLLDENSVESNAKLAMLEEFRNVVDEDGEGEQVLTDFLARVAMMSDVDNHDSNANAVTCMTVHSAKGLEFPAVFLVGLEENLFPSVRTRTLEEIEGERRLFYVAITRAEEIIYLSGAKRRTVYGTFKHRRPSRFLSELKKELLSGDVAQMRSREYSVYDDERASRMPEERMPLPFGGGTGEVKKYDGGYGGNGKKSDIDIATFARSGTRADRRADVTKFSIGDRVVHPRFGRGSITEMDAEKKLAVVEFDETGRKKLDIVKSKIEKSI